MEENEDDNMAEWAKRRAERKAADREYLFWRAAFMASAHCCRLVVDAADFADAAVAEAKKRGRLS